MKKIVIFASGSGSNAQNIVDFSRINNTSYIVEAIFCNNPNAFVVQRANELGIPCFVFNKKDFTNDESNIVLQKLRSIDPSLIVLAGFLLLIPPIIIKTFSNKIINIHPALLPNYGGKGMFGEHVHNAVIANCESESGITIHYVTEQYDEGMTILQKTCMLDSSDSPTTLASKIHLLEQEWFPVTIDNLLSNNN